MSDVTEKVKIEEARKVYQPPIVITFVLNTPDILGASANITESDSGVLLS